MKNLIIEALNSYKIDLDSINIPTTKKIEKTISIFDVSPKDLLSFMEENRIPDTAEFDGRDNGYDGYDDFLLSWYVEMPMSEKEIEIEKEKAIKKRFNYGAFRKVHDTLVPNGYKRISSWSDKFKKFADTTVYDMFIVGNFDQLAEYYSLYFKKEI